jgi:hypothetical protein
MIFDENIGSYVDTTAVSESSEPESEITLTTRPINMFLVFVPGVGKWFKSDPDSEEEIVLDKDFYSAFEFKTFAHAKRALDRVAIERNLDAHIFGDIYEQ